MPGAIQSVTGIGDEVDWQVVQSMGTVGKSTINKGRKISENISIATLITTDEEYAKIVSLLALIRPPPPAKIPAVDVVNARFQWCGINKVAYKNHVPPPPDLRAGFLWQLTLIEYRKGVAYPIGPANPAIVDNSTPQPRTDLEKSFDQALQQAGLAGTPGPPGPAAPSAGSSMQGLAAQIKGAAPK